MSNLNIDWPKGLWDFVKEQAKLRKIDEADYLHEIADAERLRVIGKACELVKLSPEMKVKLEKRMQDIAEGKVDYIEANQAFASLRLKYCE